MLHTLLKGAASLGLTVITYTHVCVWELDGISVSHTLTHTEASVVSWLCTLVEIIESLCSLCTHISCGSVHSVILLSRQDLPASLPWLSHSKKANMPERKKTAYFLFSQWSGRQGVNCICWIRLLITKFSINELIWHAVCLARSQTLCRASQNSCVP